MTEEKHHTEAEAHRMQDFDRAFTYQCVARANAIAGNRAEALKYLELADKAGQAIAGEEDKELFFSDLNGGDCGGVK
jgi:hypothetical protein